METFALLIAGHFLADFSLQTEYMATHKSRKTNPDSWQIVLFAHATIHAGVVLLVTGYLWLFFAELVAHFVIDWAKGEGKFDFESDQILHILCKILWMVPVFYGLTA